MPGVQTHATISSFLIWFQGSDSGHPACTTSTSVLWAVSPSLTLYFISEMALGAYISSSCICVNVLKWFLFCVCDIIPATNNPTEEEFIWGHGFGDVSPWLPAPIFWSRWWCEGVMWWGDGCSLTGVPETEKWLQEELGHSMDWPWGRIWVTSFF